MNVLIVKTGALGDVVRTQFFAKYLVEQKGYNISWVADESSNDLLTSNPYIKDVYIGLKEAGTIVWDLVFSLEDDESILEQLAKLNFKKLVGLYIDQGQIKYTLNSAAWNDMGLHSRFGIDEANRLKRLNEASHLDIFSSIFDLENVAPNWKGLLPTSKLSKNTNITVGLNLFAGSRWPNKSAPPVLIHELMNRICECNDITRVLLIGNECDWKPFISNNSKVSHTSTPRYDDLAREISNCDVLLTSDSLAVHISAAVGTPYVCFFGPTSAAEVSIPNLRHLNIRSSLPGYASYSPHAKITGLTANEMFAGLLSVLSSDA